MDQDVHGVTLRARLLPPMHVTPCDWASSVVHCTVSMEKQLFHRCVMTDYGKPFPVLFPYHNRYLLNWQQCKWYQVQHRQSESARSYQLTIFLAGSTGISLVYLTEQKEAKKYNVRVYIHFNVPLGPSRLQQRAIAPCVRTAVSIQRICLPTFLVITTDL